MHSRYTTPPGCRTPRVGLIVRPLAGSRGFFPTDLPRGLRRGLRPSSTLGLNTEHPCRGASLPDSDRDDPACRSRRGGAPEGSTAFSPGVEARSADDPGFLEIRLIYTTPIGCRTSLGGRPDSATPWRGRRDFSPPIYPGVFVGASALSSTPGLNTEHPCRGASLPDSDRDDPACRSLRGFAPAGSGIGRR